MAKKKNKTKIEPTLEELVSQLTKKDYVLADRQIKRFEKFITNDQREISDNVLKLEIEMYLKNNATLTIFTAMCIVKAMREKDKKYKHKSRSMQSYIKYRNRPKSRTLYASYC